MRFQCPFCRGIVAVDNADLGIDVQCGHCGEVVTVPYSRVTTGAVIADFIILEELGRGGMGIVYLTHQISLDRPAALKVLSDTYANNAEFVVNFIKEARAAAKLNHPHIVQAYAVGEDEGIFYFAMENIDGETMKQVLKRKKIIPVDEAILIIQQIAEALDYAWKEQKLIHRDIKPDNIMITKNGRGKLADLGLSRVAGELDDSEDDEVMGTPQYISPEHLTGAPMDVRSDIYSLGATLFHLITGKFPFEGRTATEIARKHLEEKLVPPHEVNSDIPEDVSLIVVKMMAKNVKKRYQDAEELVDDLRLVRRGKTPSTATEGVSKTAAKKSPGRTTSRNLKKATGKFKITNTGRVGQSSTASGRIPTNSGVLSGSGVFTSTSLSMDQPRKGPFVWIVIIILLFLAGGGGFAYWKFAAKPASANVVTPKPVAVKPSPNKIGQTKTGEVSSGGGSFADQAKKINDFIVKNPKRGLTILKMLETFFEKKLEPKTGEDRRNQAKFEKYFLQLDEARIERARNKLRDKELEELEYLERAYKKKKERERKIALDKKRTQERAAELKRMEEEKAQLLEERLQKYKESLETTKNSMRRRFIDYVQRGNYKDAIAIFDLTAKEPENASGKSEKEQEVANEYAEWGKKMQNCISETQKVTKLITDSGTEMAGTQVEVKRGALGKIKSINDGKLTLNLMIQNKVVTVPVDSLANKYLVRLLKKAAEKAGDSNGAFYYMLSNGIFYKIGYLAPDDFWKNEADKVAYEYFKVKLKHGSDAEKAKLHKEYGRMSEFKKAQSDLAE
jgi:predicted Zn finger-like uncharacterized protein